MPWGRWDDQLYDNGKVASFSDKAYRLWGNSISYANRHRTGGRLTMAQVNVLTKPIRATQRIVDELVEKRGWEESDGGYRIHDFLEFNEAPEALAARDEERRVARVEAGRIGGVRSGETRRRQAEANEASASIVLPENDPFASSKNEAKRSPVPVPSPVLSTSPEETVEVEKPLSPQQTPLERVLVLNGKSGYSAPFEEFWRHYPRRIEKHAGWLAWERALKSGAQSGELIHAAVNLAVYVDEQGTEERFIPHAATFLGPQRKYADFIAGVPHSRAPKTIGQRNRGTILETTEKLERELGVR